MKTKLTRSLLLVCLGLAGLSIHAEEFRIGFINTDRIFKESSTAKVAQTKLEQEFSKREKELMELGNGLKSNSEKLERDSPTLSDSQRTTRQRQLSEQVLEKANKVVKQIAEAEKYDVILQEAVYISPKHDITDKVIKVINSGK